MRGLPLTFGRILARLIGTRGAVLCLHGIAAREDRRPDSMHLPLEQLAELVRLLRNVGRLVALDEFIERANQRGRTHGLIALTADDAYASWLEAETLIRTEQIPITLFAVSSALDRGERFWWDRLEECAMRAEESEWRRFEEACGLPATYRAGHAGDVRYRAMRQWILAEYAGRCPPHVDAALVGLERAVGHITPQRSMTADELAGFMERTGTVSVGVHTASHAALPFLSDADVIHEVESCYKALQQALPAVLPYLAIPYGLYDARTISLAASAGMTASLTVDDRPPGYRLGKEHGVPRSCLVQAHDPARVMLKLSRLGQLMLDLRSRRSDAYPVLPSATS